jgi:hypothetical protein
MVNYGEKNAVFRAIYNVTDLHRGHCPKVTAHAAIFTCIFTNYCALLRTIANLFREKKLNTGIFLQLLHFHDPQIKTTLRFRFALASTIPF